MLFGRGGAHPLNQRQETEHEKSGGNERKSHWKRGEATDERNGAGENEAPTKRSGNGVALTHHLCAATAQAPAVLPH